MAINHPPEIRRHLCYCLPACHSFVRSLVKRGLLSNFTFSAIRSPLQNGLFTARKETTTSRQLTTKSVNTEFVIYSPNLHTSIRFPIPFLIPPNEWKFLLYHRRSRAGRGGKSVQRSPRRRRHSDHDQTLIKAAITRRKGIFITHNETHGLLRCIVFNCSASDKTRDSWSPSVDMVGVSTTKCRHFCLTF